MISTLELYDPDQPREPAGSSDGGQWTDGGGGGGLSADAEQEATKIYDQPHEHGAAWKPDGTLIGRYSSSEAGHVKTPDPVLQGATGGTMIHNHPGGASGFSPGDLDSAAWLRVGTTSVVGKLDGQRVTYTASGFDHLTDNVSDASLLGERIAKDLQREYVNSDATVSRAFMHGTWGDEPSQDFGHALRVHWALKRVAAKHGFTYHADWRGKLGSLDREGTLDDALDLMPARYRGGDETEAAHVPEATQRARKTGETVRFKDWPALAKTGQAPWQRSKEDFVAGRVPGFRVDPTMRAGLHGHMYDASGTITLSPDAFDGDPESLKLLIYHELGHAATQPMIISGAFEPLLKPYRFKGEGAASQYDVPGAASFRPEEALADVFMHLMTQPNMVNPEHPDDLAEAYWKKYQPLLDEVRRSAKTAGLWHEEPGPTPQMIARRKKRDAMKLAEFHLYSPDQPREPSGTSEGGRFADAGGGAGIPSAEAMGDVTVEKSQEHDGLMFVVRTPKMYVRAVVRGTTATVPQVRNKFRAGPGQTAQDNPAPADFLKVMHRMIREVKAAGATQIVADIANERLAALATKLGATVEKKYLPGGSVAYYQYVLPLDSPKLAKLAEVAAASFILLDRKQTMLAAQWGLSEWPLEWSCALVEEDVEIEPDTADKWGEDDCKWVTLDNGAKVCIGGKGEITKGPQALVGQHIRDVRGPTPPPRKPRAAKGPEEARRVEGAAPWHPPQPLDQERQAFLDETKAEGVERAEALFKQAQDVPESKPATRFYDLPLPVQETVWADWAKAQMEKGATDYNALRRQWVDTGSQEKLDFAKTLDDLDLTAGGFRADTWDEFSPDEQARIHDKWLAVARTVPGENIEKTAERLWTKMSPKLRLEFAQSYGLDRVGLKAPATWNAFDLEEPGYQQTQKVAHHLVKARATELWKQRDLGDPPNWSEVSRWLWGPGGWKSDSHSKEALALQRAAIDVFGANNHLTPQQEQDAEAAFADLDSKGNGREIVQTYVRALWDTTQFLLNKAGKQDVTLYRAVILPREKLATQAAVFYGGRPGEIDGVALPKLMLRQNALQSTSFRQHTPNSWEGVSSSPEGGRRVVVSMTVPASAILSLPVYGQNVQREQEAVVMGTPWKAWRAWYDKAPNVDTLTSDGVPLKDPLADWYYHRYHKELRERAKNLPIDQDQKRIDPTDDDLVIDFSDPAQNGGLGHWLVPSSRPETTDTSALTEAIRMRHGAGSPIHLFALALQQGHPYARALLRRRSTDRLLAQGAEDDCHWVTLDSGAKVCIQSSTGEITKGPSTLVGQNISSVRSSARGEAPQAEPRQWAHLTPQQQDTARTAFMEAERSQMMERAVYMRRLEIEERARQALVKDRVFLLGVANQWLDHNPELAKTLQLDSETLVAVTSLDKNGVPRIDIGALPDGQEWNVSAAKEAWPNEVMRAFDDKVYERRNAIPDDQLEASLDKQVTRDLGKRWETSSLEDRFNYHLTPLAHEQFDFGPVKETEAQSKADLLRLQGVGKAPLVQEVNGVPVLTKRGREIETKLRQSGTSLRELTAAFTPRFPKGMPDYQTTLTIEPGYTENTVTIHGTITAPDGTRVGNFGRSIYFDSKHASHMEFFVESTDDKNKGIAGLFSIATDEYYRKLGLKNVQLQAISQERHEITGHQVWPSQGFTWSERRGADMYREAFASVIKARYGADSVEAKTAENMRSREAPAWEYTAFKDAQGESVGWYLMHLEKIGRMPPFPPVQHSPAMFRPLDQPDSVAEKIWQAHVQRTLKKLGLPANAGV